MPLASPAVKVAFTLSALLACDLVHFAAVKVVHGKTMVTGWARVAFHVEQASFLAFGAVVVALVFATYHGRAWHMVPAAWALGCALLALAYPDVRGDALHAVIYPRVAMAGAVACGAAFVTAERWQWSDLPALLLAIGEASAIVGPYWMGTPMKDWKHANMASAVVYSVILLTWGAQWILVRRRRERS